LQLDAPDGDGEFDEKARKLTWKRFAAKKGANTADATIGIGKILVFSE
jgi:hypothetical protein